MGATAEVRARQVGAPPLGGWMRMTDWIASAPLSVFLGIAGIGVLVFVMLIWIRVG